MLAISKRLFRRWSNGGVDPTFHTPNDDPSVNAYADANVLRSRLKSYVNGIRSFVLASYSNAVFELLWPMDVNDPDTCRLTRYINLPSEWQTRAGSGFDTFMCEGFQYGGINHNLDQANLRRPVVEPRYCEGVGQ